MKMPYFENDGVKIYHEIEGEGPDLIMIHGFAASIEYNWRLTNWIKALKDENRLILMDCRGHGKSDKPRDPAQYGFKMIEDVMKLMDHLSITRSNFFGYSMGSWLTLNLLLREPERVNCAILGGFVLPSPGGRETALRNDPIIDGLLAENLDQVKDAVAIEFRRFAESTGSNLKALAAVMKSSLYESSEFLADKSSMKKTLKKIKVPVMSVVGTDDFLPGDKTLIAKLVPRACHFQIQGKDHLTVVPDRKFKVVVKAFLNWVNSK